MENKGHTSCPCNIQASASAKTLHIASANEHHMPSQVVQPQPAGHHGEGFARAVEINAVSLLFRRALVAAGRRPVRKGIQSCLGKGKHGRYLPSYNRAPPLC